MARERVKKKGVKVVDISKGKKHNKGKKLFLDNGDINPELHDLLKSAAREEAQKFEQKNN